MRHQHAAAVAEVHFGAGHDPYALIGKQHPHALDDLTKLAAVGACVHAHAAAHAAGDAVGEFQPRQSLTAGEIGHAGQRGAAVGLDPVPTGRHDLRHVAGVNDQAIHAAVGKQHIGAVAQHKGPRAAFLGKAQQQYQLLGVFRKGHPPRGAADAERGVLAQRLLRRYGQIGQIGLQFFV